MTATKTRKKQQTEAIRHAIQERMDKQRSERQSFLITTIPITQLAAYEPGLDHSPGENIDLEEEEDGARAHGAIHAAHSVFPSCLCSSVMQIVACLDDAAVNSDGCAVYETAYQVIWVCLVEDSALFLRYVLERLTRDHQQQMFKLLRHLIRFVPRLPQQAAFACYNYIIGYVMFYVRSTHECSQQVCVSRYILLSPFHYTTSVNLSRMVAVRAKAHPRLTSINNSHWFESRYLDYTIKLCISHFHSNNI